MTRSVYLSYPEAEPEVNNPIRILMCAILERAYRDLVPVVSLDPKYLRSAIAWFSGRTGYRLFKFEDVVEELKLSPHVLGLIRQRVKLAKEYVRDNNGQFYYDSKNKLQRERQQSGTVGRTLADHTRLPKRPENPTIQWNGWYIGHSG